MVGPVAIEVRALSGPSAGVARYVRGLLRGLRSVCPDLPLLLITDHARGLKTDDATRGVPGIAVPPAHALLRLWWDTWALPRAVRRFRPQLLHRTKPAGVPLRSRLPPIVMTIYDTISLEHPETQTHAQRAYWALQLPRAARSADHILTISEASRRAIIDRFHLPEDRVTVTYPGIEPTFHPPAKTAVDAVRARYGLRKPYLLTVGTIEPRKNVDGLLRAFAHIADHIPHDLVVAGRWGWKVSAVRTAAQDRRITSRVRFLGGVAPDDLPPLYGAADAFLFLSRAEGFGFPPLEAMACGTPVIASNAGSLPEVVGDAAILVDPTDERAIAAQMQRLLADPNLQAHLRAKGRVQAQRFTWEDTARRTIAVYERVVAEHSMSR